MRLTTRLKAIEARHHSDDKEPRLVIVMEDEGGIWTDRQGCIVDSDTIGPQIRIIRLVERSDGPK